MSSPPAMPDESNPRVFILIPVHNRRETTLACLKILKEAGDLDRYAVIVIDDGSTDGTGESIAELYPQVLILEGDGDLWWTGAISMGMTYAAEQAADYIIWLNDDCHPLEQALTRLVRFMESHTGTIAAPACRLAGSGNAIENGCRHRQRFTAQPGETVEVESVSGYCVGIPREVCVEIGYPDVDRFPHYGGDDMYTLKASRSGFSVCLVGDAVVTVHGMVTQEHTFTAYVRDRFEPRPSFRQVFLEKKSRYCLSTQYYYLTEKYPYPAGLLLFSAKMVSWFVQYGRIYAFE